MSSLRFKEDNRLSDILIDARELRIALPNNSKNHLNIARVNRIGKN